MTEPIDKATKDLIEKEANDLLLKYPADRALSEGRKKWYIAGATVWAEKLKQERNKAIELEQEVRKYVFWHDKFFNDTIVGQPPSLQPLRDLIKDKSHE